MFSWKLMLRKMFFLLPQSLYSNVRKSRLQRKQPIKCPTQLKLEVLEDRITPADLTVTNLSGDPNTIGSLPHEVSIAQTRQTIGFTAGLRGTINLSSEI